VFWKSISSWSSYHSLASPKATAILFAEVEFSKETPGAFGDCVIGEAENLTKNEERSFNRSLALGKIGGWGLEFDSLTIVFSFAIFSGIRLCHERISYDKYRKGR